MKATDCRRVIPYVISLFACLEVFIISAKGTITFEPDETICHNLNALQDTIAIHAEDPSNSFVADTTNSDSRISNLKQKVVGKITRNQPDKESRSDDKDRNFSNEQSAYEGNIIRDIDYYQLEVFGQTVEDTVMTPTHLVEKLGNGLHITTQEYVLRNQSLVKIGEPLDLYTLAENERLLRELPFIDDARVIIIPAGKDSVDLLFVTKDVFPLAFSIELLDIAYGRASIFNKNALGLGHELTFDLTWNYNRHPYYGYKFRYGIQNIGNTFFSLEASYENQWNIEAFRFNLNRNFFSQNTKFAGGVGFERIYSLKDIIYPDSVQQNVKVDYNLYDLWLGRAIKVNLSESGKYKTNITINGRFTKYESFRRPQVSEILLHDYWERNTFLSSIGISRQGYYKSRLIYGYGRPEDVPVGLSFSFTAGMEINEFNNRSYGGISFSKGSNLRKYGYLYSQVACGTFINNGFEQGILQLELDYFSDLINKTGRYKYRVFFDGLYKAGYNRFADEYMELTKRDGIRGLSSAYLRGNQRINFNIESVCYSPHYLAGFRFLYYLFIDIGIISNESTILFNNPVYTGFGAGMRIHNDNLVFDAIQLRFAYYPVLPESAIPEYFFATTSSDRRFNNFVVPKPEVLQYQNR